MALLYIPVPKNPMVLQNVGFQTKQLQYKAYMIHDVATMVRASCSRSHIQRKDESQLTFTETVSDRGWHRIVGLTQQVS